MTDKEFQASVMRFKALKGALKNTHCPSKRINLLRKMKQEVETRKW